MRHLFLISVLFTCICCKRQTTILHEDLDLTVINNKLIYRSLLDNGYLKHLSKEYTQKFREYIFSNYDTEFEIPDIYIGESFIGEVKRHFHIDGEYLWDRGGMNSFLNDGIKPFCEVSGLHLNIENIIENLNRETHIANYSLIVNDKLYKILDSHKVQSTEVWRIVPYEIGKMLNDQLQKQNMDEKFYLIGFDNTCSGIFLSQDQFEYLHNLIQDKWSKPYTLEQWNNLYLSNE